MITVLGVQRLSRKMLCMIPSAIAATSMLDSILTLRVPGVSLGYFDPSQVDLDVVIADLVHILTRMRSFACPFG